MFGELLVGMVASALILGVSYENRMQRGKRLIDLKRLTVKQQIRLSFGVGFALAPATVVCWIVCPQLNYLVAGFAVAQIVIDVVYLLIMDKVCLFAVRRNNLLKHLPAILKLNGMLNVTTADDYKFIKKELYVWYGAKYTTREIDYAQKELKII